MTSPESREAIAYNTGAWLVHFLLFGSTAERRDISMKAEGAKMILRELGLMTELEQFTAGYESNRVRVTGSTERKAGGAK